MKLLKYLEIGATLLLLVAAIMLFLMSGSAGRHGGGELIFYSVLIFLLAFAILFFLVLERRPKVQETPKSFLKKCVRCGKEIPIASLQCQYCGAKQN